MSTCYKSYILLYLNFSGTQKLKSWLFKNETKAEFYQILEKDFSWI